MDLRLAIVLSQIALSGSNPPHFPEDFDYDPIWCLARSKTRPIQVTDADGCVHFEPVIITDNQLFEAGVH